MTNNEKDEREKIKEKIKNDCDYFLKNGGRITIIPNPLENQFLYNKKMNVRFDELGFHK